MAGGIDWFRWHHGSVTDPKFQLVARQVGASVAEVIAVWACLLEAASQAEDRGHPGEPDLEALECALGLAEGLASAIYSRMTERGLVTEDGAIASWNRRQPKREREGDSSAERTRVYRERQKQPGDAKENHVTPSDATQRQETPRGEESRGDMYSVPNGTGAEAPEPHLNGKGNGSEAGDAVWDEGVRYLTSCGVAEKGARSFLGKMRKVLGSDLIAAELIIAAQRQQVSEPIPWLRAAAERRVSSGRTKAGVVL